MPHASYWGSNFFTITKSYIGECGDYKFTRNIILSFRDLKLDNLLLDRDGYVKVIYILIALLILHLSLPTLDYVRKEW